MKGKKILIVEDDDFSGGAVKKILERENRQDIQRDGKERYSSFQRVVFIGLILSLFMLSTLRISTAHESFPKMNGPNFRIIDSQKTCLESISLSLTEDQKKALDSLHRSYIAQARPIRTEVFSLKINLRHLLSDPNVQPEILFDQQKRISVLQAKLEELSLSYQVNARSVLTKEQLKRLPEGWGFEMGLGHDIPIMDIGGRFKKGVQ
jgi:hypothetical protein